MTTSESNNSVNFHDRPMKLAYLPRFSGSIFHIKGFSVMLNSPLYYIWVNHLQLGLAVQLHHLYRSRFLIDSLSRMGFASTYSEVQRFEVNAACSLAPDVLGSDMDVHDHCLLFAGDNVDHNIITLDGKGTFHGMGMIAAITPGKQATHGILRQKMADLKLVEMTNIDIDYCFPKHVIRNIEFQSLQTPHLMISLIAKWTFAENCRFVSTRALQAGKA